MEVLVTGDTSRDDGSNQLVRVESNGGCERCGDNTKTMHCKDCNVSLCVPCSLEMHSNTIWRQHALYSLDDIKIPEKTSGVK
jgi:hypothetical protein